MWSARHVACKHDERLQILLGKPNWRVHLEGLDVNGRDLNADSEYVCWVRLLSLYDQWQAIHLFMPFEQHHNAYVLFVY